MPEEIPLSRVAIERVGGDPDNLGFVGLEVILPPEFLRDEVLDPEWEYKSPVLKYVKGYDINHHITLIYGLLFDAAKNRDLVDGVLKDWFKPNLVVLPEVEAFDGDDDYNVYSAIVLSVGTNEWDLRNLKEANDQLRKLPHVCGFPVYNPHVTVGYVKREFAAQAVSRLRDVEVRPLLTGGLDYGS